MLAASLDEGADREQELVHDLVTRRVDGLRDHARERAPGLPRQRAALGHPGRLRRPSAHAGVDADSVTVDNHRGGRLAAEHLLAQGHRRIAMLVDLETIPTAARRLAGFTDGYAERGLPPGPAPGR